MGGGGGGGGGTKEHPESQFLSKPHVVYQQLQANQKSQQDEIENRLKEIQKEVKACTHENVLRYSGEIFKRIHLQRLSKKEPKTVGQRLASEKSAP